VKRQSTEWGTICASSSPDRELTFRIHKEPQKVNTKITNNPVNNWANELRRQYSKDEAQISNKSSSSIRETQIKTTLRLGVMIHACNCSYSGGRDQEDYGSKPAQANSLRPGHENTQHKEGLVEWLK
jgi:hypothetical protein